MKLRYRLLLAGTSVAALTACIGLENAKSAVTISAFVIGTIVTNAAIRWCVVKSLIKVGLIHPAIERYWPRVPWRVLQIIRKAIIEKWEKLFRMGRKSTGGFTPTLSTLLLRYHPDNIILGRARLYGDDVKALAPTVKAAIKKKIRNMEQDDFADSPVRDRGRFVHETKSYTYTVIWLLKVFQDDMMLAEAEHPDDPENSYRLLAVSLSDEDQA